MNGLSFRPCSARTSAPTAAGKRSLSGAAMLLLLEAGRRGGGGLEIAWCRCPEGAIVGGGLEEEEEAGLRTHFLQSPLISEVK